MNFQMQKKCAAGMEPCAVYVGTNITLGKTAGREVFGEYMQFLQGGIAEE